MWRLAPLLVLCTACDTIFGLRDVGLRPPSDAFIAPLDRKLVAHYTLDSLDNDNTAVDSAGDHDAKCIQGCPTVVPGHVANENALVFNASLGIESAEFLLIAAADDLQLTPEYTIALWIRVDGAGGCIVQQTYGSDMDNAWQLCINAAGNFEFFSSENGEPDGLYHLEDNSHVGEWQHVAIVHTSTTKLIYRNGAELIRKDGGTATFTIGAPTYIGADIDTGSNVMDPFDGAVDEVRIYARALDMSELIELALGNP
jgi:Concanavalin A-like lectin/glucanases superfamily